MRALLLLYALAVAGCDSTAEAPPFDARVSARAEIALGGRAVVDGVDVLFERVAEDSRCPDSAVCIWEGMALVDLVLDGDLFRVRVANPDDERQTGVRVGSRVVYAIALTGDALSDVDRVVTVATARPE